MSKGAIGIEFVVATALFLAAFWFIYLQSAFMLTPQLQRNDVRELGVEFYSTVLAIDADEGFAYEAGGNVRPNILDRAKLIADNGQPCADVQSNLMTGMEFAFEVTTATGNWACTTDVPKEGVVKRAVFVKTGGLSYQAGVLEVWAG